MSTDDLFHSLLRPAVLHMLRAAGFNGAKPSVVDTVVDLTARYLTLLASHTAYNAYSSHNDPTPDISDVRVAMQDCGLLVPTLTAAEELWKEILRKPLEEYDEDSGARSKEEKRRDAEDTADVTEFIEWVKGPKNREIRRIAGLVKSQPPAGQQPTATEQLDAEELEDYLSSLMKKHNKSGQEQRFQGTVLGKTADAKEVKIEGGAADSIREWCLKTRERAAKTAESTRENHELTNHVADLREESEDSVMETQ
ncbi:hypothetical protein BU26DRAFT_515794 [Trematosphaeria pertusa]|uniref:Bromodomain associated domain-containing protein n=1 Tax=Trematosphaeria pertusa TaxID=390896 RepID=A0A6A6ISQ1_9PLEO|nr:uncharacterized protein BU26DRAFT_515794 [Trematosphaeria pertusa]KAF2253436.1 hypothetical protein BU26DRAFT_515794 [Trematosphaeria pertusa]